MKVFLLQAQAGRHCHLTSLHRIAEASHLTLLGHVGLAPTFTVLVLSMWKYSRLSVLFMPALAKVRLSYGTCHLPDYRPVDCCSMIIRPDLGLSQQERLQCMRRARAFTINAVPLL